ncbi:MAG TPA: hypothetical protein VNO30_39110 [Kofleriaceae bacterium]|nr:hypothetical protein [Kofleriaceae bacterium]
MKKIKISLENPEIRAIWETALEARREVASWPAWKRGDDVVPSNDDTPASSTPVPKQDPDR